MAIGGDKEIKTRDDKFTAYNSYRWKVDNDAQTFLPIFMVSCRVSFN